MTTKWQEDGWELVSQEKGSLLQSKLTFRRTKPKVPWRPLALFGGMALILIIVSVIIGAIQGEGGTPEPTTSPSEAAVVTNAQVSEEATHEPAAETSEHIETAEMLTAKNNDDFAALLASGKQDFDAHRAFVTKYQDRTVEFDGSVVLMMAHGDYKTRFDTLIYHGNYDGSHKKGPSFSFIDVNYYDFKLTGPNVPDEVSEGQELRFIARIEDFDEEGGSILLDPISTESR